MNYIDDLPIIRLSHLKGMPVGRYSIELDGDKYEIELVTTIHGRLNRRRMISPCCGRGAMGLRSHEGSLYCCQCLWSKIGRRYRRVFERITPVSPTVTVERRLSRSRAPEGHCEALALATIAMHEKKASTNK